MILPQDDESSFIEDYYSNHYPFNINDIKQVRSPTLPLHFDKSYLPKDICEKEYIGMAECMSIYNLFQLKKDQQCTLQISKFQSCRRVRDQRIVQGIRQWQIQHIISLDRFNQGMYTMGMGKKLERLKDQHNRLPSTVKGMQKSGILQFQMKQLKFRLDYINNTINSL